MSISPSHLVLSVSFARPCINQDSKHQTAPLRSANRRRFLLVGYLADVTLGENVIVHA